MRCRRLKPLLEASLARECRGPLAAKFRQRPARQASVAALNTVLPWRLIRVGRPLIPMDRKLSRTASTAPQRRERSRHEPPAAYPSQHLLPGALPPRTNSIEGAQWPLMAIGLSPKREAAARCHRVTHRVAVQNRSHCLPAWSAIAVITTSACTPRSPAITRPLPRRTGRPPPRCHGRCAGSRLRPGRSKLPRTSLIPVSGSQMRVTIQDRMHRVDACGRHRRLAGPPAGGDGPREAARKTNQGSLYA